MEKVQFDKLVVSIARSGAKLRRDIQAAAVHAIEVSLKHGDITCGQRLYEACAKSLRRDSLIAYFEKYGAFAWLKADKKLVHFARQDVACDTEYLEMVTDTFWDEAKKEPEPVSKYDVEVAFDRFMKTAHKMAANPNVSVKHKDLLEMLDALDKQYAMVQLTSESEELRERGLIPALKAA